MTDAMTPTRAWVQCVCGYARGRADAPREDCPVCGPALTSARQAGRDMSAPLRSEGEPRA